MSYLRELSLLYELLLDLLSDLSGVLDILSLGVTEMELFSFKTFFSSSFSFLYNSLPDGDGLSCSVFWSESYPSFCSGWSSDRFLLACSPLCAAPCGFDWIGVLVILFPEGIVFWAGVAAALAVLVGYLWETCVWVCSVVRVCWSVVTLWAWTGVVCGSACAFLAGDRARAWSC